MLEFFINGGYSMIPLVVIALVVAALAIRSWLRIDHESTEPDAVVETGIDAVVFWGAYGVVIGLLGTLGGIASAASAIQLAGETTTALIWGGIGVSLHTTIFGLAIFSVALLLWFGLRVRYRRRIAVD